MERALAVVDASEAAKELVREAGELAGGVDAELLLVHVTSEEEYNQQREAMAAIPEQSTTYSRDRAEQGARQFARDIANEVLGDVAVDDEPVGLVGDHVDGVLDLAAERGCDHVFVAGRKRSPTGKAMFGDTTQRIILDFDGAVTVITQ
jgi:nucleotide-binding universal stress UspA family protein